MPTQHRGPAPQHDPAPELLPELLDYNAAARITGTSERLIRRLAQERQIPTVKVGRYVRIRPADLADYLERNTRPAAGADR